MSANRDNLYYLDTIIFQVESRLFKVYRHHFLASEIFRVTFSLPSGDLKAEGSSDENPFLLRGIMANDFQALLKVIYPLSSTFSDITRDEWISGLNLSTMYDLKDARSLCIQELSKVDIHPIDKIVFGKKYRVPAWVKEGYEALITKVKVMTAEELLSNANIVGWDTMAKVLRLRESGLGSTMQSMLKRLNTHCCDSEHRENRVTHYTIHCTKCHAVGSLDEEIEREFLQD